VSYEFGHRLSGCGIIDIGVGIHCTDDYS
jgi:hypothetical protein